MQSLAEPSVSQAPSVSAALQRKEVWFEKAADTAYQAVLAISQGQEAQARNEIDKLRLLRSVLSVGEARESVATGIEAATPLTLQRMRYAVDAIQASQEVIGLWVQSHTDQLGSLAELDLLGWQRLIDHTLPVAWNFEADVLLVYGRVRRDLVEVLQQRGQRRVLFVLHPDDTDSGDECLDPTGASAAAGAGASRGVSSAAAVGDKSGMRVVRTEAEVQRYVEGLLTPYPKHLARMDIDQGDGPRPDDVVSLIQKSIMTTWMSVNTRRLFAQRWVEQGIANMPAVAWHNNLRELDGAFQGRPAILISPGPSLDKNIEQIRQAKGKALLIAPLQTLRRLYKANIQPDFVLVLDATDLTTDPYDFFNEVPAEFLTTLIIGFNCHPHVVKKFQRVYFFSTGGPLDHWLQDMLSKPLLGLEGSSVAVSAMMLAQHWGCNPIVLTGQDLALADSGKRYAEDAQLNNLTAPKLMTLPGYHGGTVQTPSDYFLFHHQFELIAKNMATSHPSVRLCNCTEGGAFIAGYEHVPLLEVLRSDVLDQPPTDWVAAQDAHDSVEQRQRRRVSAMAQLRAIGTAVDVCEAQADKCRRLSLHLNGSPAYLQKLQAQEKHLRTLVQSIKGFSTVFQAQIEAAQQAGTEAQSLRDNLAASRALYAVVSQGCQFIRPLLAQALQELNEQH